MSIFPQAAAGATSLTAGWKVELGVGDPDTIPGVGLYDTSRYADAVWVGEWVNGNAADSGEYRFLTATETVSSLRMNYLDALSVDRKAELLALVPGSSFGVVTPSGSQIFEVNNVVDVPATDQVSVSVSPAHRIPNVMGQLGSFTSYVGEVAVYGSNDLFGYLVDVTSRVEGLTTRRGRERFTSRFRTGVATVTVLNTDGAFTPPSGSGPIGVLPLRPGRVVRITHDGGAVFNGFIDSFDGNQDSSGKVSTKIRCVDQMGQFTRNDLPAVDPPEGAGELSFARMLRLLDRHVIDYTFSTRGEDVNTLQSTTMAQDLMSELAVTADSEGGGVWVGKNGGVVASGRDFFTDLVDAGVVHWTVGGSAPIKITSYQDEWAAIRIVNEAHMSRTGGTEQVRTNDESIGKYGRRTFTRLDLHNDNDTDVATLAERLVQFAGIDRLRIKELTFLPTPDSPTAEMAVVASFGDIMLVTITTIFGVSWTAPVQIFGVSHRVSAEVWTVSFLTDDTLFSGEFHAFDQTAFDPLAFS